MYIVVFNQLGLLTNYNQTRNKTDIGTKEMANLEGLYSAFVLKFLIFT